MPIFGTEPPPPAAVPTRAYTSTLVGVDLGKKRDFTAIVVLERVELQVVTPYYGGIYPPTRTPPPAVYTCHHAQRFPRGSSYISIVDRVKATLERRVFPEPLTLLVDATGPGLAVMEYFAKAQVRPQPLGVVVHWGFNTTQPSPTEWHVPKATLVTILEVLSEARPPRLLLGPRLPFAAEVRAEMQTFTAEQDLHTGHVTYEAYREQAHDDLIFALGLACWYGETQGDPRLPPVDMARALQGTQMPRHWGDGTPRPRRDRLRIFNDTYPDAPLFDQRSWDAVKNAVAEGRLVPRSPHSP